MNTAGDDTTGPACKPAGPVANLALVVDDSRATRMILGRYLRGIGYEIAEAGDGSEALDQLAQHHDIALALVDWNMPVMNGLDLVKAVRSQECYAGIRLVMVTTETEQANVEAALDAGADEYVMKPFTQDVIAGKLALLGLARDPG